MLHFRICLVFLFSCVVLVACSTQPTQNKPNDSISGDPATSASSSETSNYMAFLDRWSEALTRQDFQELKLIYADTVMYYGDNLFSATIFNRQKSYFLAHKNYRQRIPEIIETSMTADGNWNIRFSKEVATETGTKTFPSSLIISTAGSAWRILAESDDVTDVCKARGIPTATYNYTPEEVTLEGMLEEGKTFSTNTSGDPKSNGTYSYFVVWPDRPIGMNADLGSRRNEHVEETNIDRFEVLGKNSVLQKLQNKRVRVTGQFFHSDDEHNRTIVWMVVTKIVAVE
ncbi:MAG: DUF4431 domain-containing protein [Bacteroidia bacterium]